MSVQLPSLHPLPPILHPSPGAHALNISPSSFLSAALAIFCQPVFSLAPPLLWTLLDLVRAVCLPHDCDYLLLLEALIKNPAFLYLYAQGPQVPVVENVLLWKEVFVRMVICAGALCA